MGDASDTEAIRDEVRAYYTQAARAGGDGCGDSGIWGASRYDPDVLADAPGSAAELSLQRQHYLDLIAAAGLDDGSVEYTHDTGPGLHAAIIRARKP